MYQLDAVNKIKEPMFKNKQVPKTYLGLQLYNTPVASAEPIV